MNLTGDRHRVYIESISSNSSLGEAYRLNSILTELRTDLYNLNTLGRCNWISRDRFRRNNRRHSRFPEQCDGSQGHSHLRVHLHTHFTDGALNLIWSTSEMYSLWWWSQESKLIIGLALFYDAPVPPPGLFDAFLAVPANFTDVSTRSYLSLVQAAPTNFTTPTR